jgi:ComF family protein
MGPQYIEPVPNELTAPRRPAGLQSARMPTLCVICHGWCRGGICDDCERSFAAPRPRCQRCARPTAVPLERCGDCVARTPAFDRCFTFADYADPWNHVLAAFKYRQHVELARSLAAGLGRALVASGAPRPDWILPIPLSRERLRERGFNQAFELTRRLACTYGLAASATLLHRIRDTPHQTGMTRDQRARNLRDAFWVAGASRSGLGDAHVAVVDDVLTTGATANAAALALRRAGASTVDVWVVARTPLGDG